MNDRSRLFRSFSYAFKAMVLFLVLTSCQKSQEDTVGNADAMLKVNLTVGEPEEEKILVAGKSTTRRINYDVQKSEIQLNGGVSMEVSVVRGAVDGNSGPSGASAGTGLKAAAQPVVKTLEKGIKYKLVAYTEGGQYVSSVDYTYGSESSVPGLQLDAGKTYTFIVYSVNSKLELPEVYNRDLISTAGLKDISGDLMFFKKTMKLNFGDNNLNAVLQHKFSQITTYIEMDDSMTGSIEAISGTQFNPTKVTGSINFSDGGLSFPNADGSTNVSFPSVIPGARSLVSSPSFLISPGTESASFKIGSIRIDSETKNDISVPNIKIVPGQRYNLIIKFRSCSEDVTAEGMNWSYPQTSWKEGWTTYTGIYKTDEKRYYKNNEVIQNTFIAPQANYGFQFDITELDNAFNMKVNGKHIFKASDLEQIQFETASSLGIVRNIQFADGSDYATNGIDQIYNMKGSLATPLIRILISRNGEVTMLGSKVNNGPLFPLKLKNNLTFNKVTWNSTGDNTVVVTQKVAGRTIIIGKGSGKKRITCK